MASTTTNLGLTKPADTDAADISAINGNMDIIDTYANNTNQAIALQSQARTKLLNPDVLSTSIAPGLYYAIGATNIPTQTSTGYLDITVREDTATTLRTVRWRPYVDYAEYINILPNSSTWSGWDCVALKSDINNVDSYTVDGTYCYAKKKAGVVYVYGHSAGGKTLTGDGAWHTLATMPSGYRPSTNVYFAGATIDGKGISFHIATSGVLEYVLDANSSSWNYGGTFVIE